MTSQFEQNPPNDMAASAKTLADAWQNIARHSADIAHARRTMFSAYVAEGFTEDQALQLCKAV